MKYRIVDCHYTITPDSYENGEDPNKEQSAYLHINGEEFSTIEELLSYVASNFGEKYSPDYWILLPNSSGGKDSLQTDILVDEYEYKASREDIESWKAGEIELYNVHIWLIVEVFEDSHLFSEEDADLIGIEVM